MKSNKSKSVKNSKKRLNFHSEEKDYFLVVDKPTYLKRKSDSKKSIFKKKTNKIDNEYYKNFCDLLKNE